MTDTLSIVVAIVAFLALVGGWELLARRRKRHTRLRPAGAGFGGGSKITPFPSVTRQLETVMKATFEARPLMSRAESSVFYAAETRTETARHQGSRHGSGVPRRNSAHA